MRNTAFKAVSLAILSTAFALDAHAQRAIGTLHRHHHRHRHGSHQGIEIPRYVPTVRPPADQLPPGTSRPGRSRYFVPPY